MTREKSLGDYWEDATQDIKEGFDDTFGSGTIFNDAQEYLTNITIGLPKNLIKGDSLDDAFKKWSSDIWAPDTETGKALKIIGVIAAAVATGGAALNALGGTSGASASLSAMTAAPTATAAVAAAPSATAVAAASTGLTTAQMATIATTATTLASGVMSYNASKRAEAAQREGTSAAIAYQKESDDKYYAQVEQRREDLSPYLEAGYEAMGYTPEESRTNAVRDTGGGEMPGSGGDMDQNPQGTQPEFRQDGSPMPRGGKGPTDPGSNPAFAQNGAPIGPGGEATQYDQDGMPISKQGVGPGGPTNLKTFGQGYDQAQPIYGDLLNAGRDSIPQMQNYAQGGMNAYTMQQDIAGVNGPQAQQAAYDLIESEPGYEYMVDKAKSGILSGGSATGNIGSGRMGNALMEYQPQILSNAISQKYGMLSPMVASGQNASQYLTGTGGNIANNLYSGAQNTIGNIAQMGLSAAGGTPIGSPGQAPSANLINQGGIANANYSLQRDNNLANTFNSGMQNYFKLKELNANNSNNNYNYGYTEEGDYDQRTLPGSVG